MINIGDFAPEFSTKDILDNKVSFPATDHWTFISFHRFATCPFCVLRTRQLMNSYPLFEQSNVEILSIWPSSKSNMLKYIGKENSPFAMIADPQKKIFEKYHVTESSWLSAIKLIMNPLLIYNALKGMFKEIEIDSDPNLLPAEFLVSPSGEIVISHYGKHFGDHLPIHQILNKIP
jgi:peroxiredoxin Q/BCP